MRGDLSRVGVALVGLSSVLPSVSDLSGSVFGAVVGRSALVDPDGTGRTVTAVKEPNLNTVSGWYDAVRAIELSCSISGEKQAGNSSLEDALGAARLRAVALSEELTKRIEHGNDQSGEKLILTGSQQELLGARLLAITIGRPIPAELASFSAAYLATEQVDANSETVSKAGNEARVLFAKLLSGEPAVHQFISAAADEFRVTTGRSLFGALAECAPNEMNEFLKTSAARCVTTGKLADVAALLIPLGEPRSPLSFGLAKSLYDNEQEFVTAQIGGLAQYGMAELMEARAVLAGVLLSGGKATGADASGAVPSTTTDGISDKNYFRSAVATLRELQDPFAQTVVAELTRLSRDASVLVQANNNTSR